MKKLLLALFLISVLAPLDAVRAYAVENLDNVRISNDFVLEQGKTELYMSPGDSAEREISITNRSGKEVSFDVGVEDFSAGQDASQNIVFLGNRKSPFSLKDFLYPDVRSFSLKHGQRITIPIKIKVPQGTPPGGLYGAVVVSANVASSADSSAGGAKVNLSARLASLFFVRIKGDAKESGRLEKFTSAKNIYFKSPAVLLLDFKNSGNVYLAPRGEIKVTDFWGKEVRKIAISPFYVMPDSVREEQYRIDNNWLGWYRARLELDRGYGNDGDAADAYFIVVSWPFVFSAISVILILVIVLLGLKKFLKRK